MIDASYEHSRLLRHAHAALCGNIRQHAATLMHMLLMLLIFAAELRCRKEIFFAATALMMMLY